MPPMCPTIGTRTRPAAKPRRGTMTSIRYAYVSHAPHSGTPCHMITRPGHREATMVSRKLPPQKRASVVLSWPSYGVPCMPYDMLRCGCRWATAQSCSMGMWASLGWRSGRCSSGGSNLRSGSRKCGAYTVRSHCGIMQYGWPPGIQAPPCQGECAQWQRYAFTCAMWPKRIINVACEILLVVSRVEMCSMLPGAHALDVHQSRR